MLRMAEDCLIKGSGLVAGVVGRKSKFSLHLPIVDQFDVTIEIAGPNNESCVEKLFSLYPNRKISNIFQRHPDEIELRPNQRLIGNINFLELFL